MWVRDPGQQSNLSGHNPHLLVLHPPVGEDARFAEELHHNLEVGREGDAGDDHSWTGQQVTGG